MTPEQAIAAALREEFAPAVDVGGIQAMPLAGGVVARRVTQLDVSFMVGGVEQTRRYVLKHSDRREAATMRQLRPLAERCALPQLVADGEDADGAWLLLLFIHGRRLASELLLPADVAETLARVHTHFATRPDALALLPRLDSAFWQGLLDLNERTLAAAPWPAASAARRELAAGIERLRRAEQVPRLLTALPQTLLHGDVHGGNMIVSSADNRTYLIDWGNARIGPAAVDVFNGVTSMDDPVWLDYWARVAKLTGSMPPLDELRTGFLAATAQINAQYLSYAIEHLGEARSLAMVCAALCAAEQLAAIAS